MSLGITRYKSKRSYLRQLRRKRQEERLKQFEDLSRRYPLNPERLSIVAIPFEELVEKLQKRELKASNVLEAYIAKALVVNQDYNCITQFVPQCFEFAKHLDELSDI
ncbi:unnamed protein product [Allacma fusca]|uniref:Uncharacterized protein n=1 Tax=Allacma fusca TaxID=39272 RepID=A0A8J2NPN1_9HEXA|nr:unnamed protein product [Allacma fusca]